MKQVSETMYREHELLHDDSADDACPLCIADQLEATATARYESLSHVPMDELLELGRYYGAVARAAGSKLDLADAIRHGDVIVTDVERSKAYGLSIRYRRADR